MPRASRRRLLIEADGVRVIAGLAVPDVARCLLLAPAGVGGILVQSTSRRSTVSIRQAWLLH